MEPASIVEIPVISQGESLNSDTLMRHRSSLMNGIRSCKACILNETRTKSVPGIAGKYYEHGGICILAEIPGVEADKSGYPFEGKDGGSLDKLLASAGIERKSLLITSTVRCRPPRGRLNDYPSATLYCQQWCQAEFAVYKPSVIVVMGAQTIKLLYGAKASATKYRGKPRATTSKFALGAGVWVPTFHPSFTYFNDSVEELIVSDLILARDIHASIS